MMRTVDQAKRRHDFRPILAAAIVALVIAHHLLGTHTVSLQAVRSGAVVVAIAIGLPTVSWTPIDALRWTTGLLAVPALLFGTAGATFGFAVAPLLYGFCLLAALGDDWQRAHPAVATDHPAIGLAASIAAIAVGSAWVVVVPLAIAFTTHIPLAGAAIGLWIVAAGGGCWWGVGLRAWRRCDGIGTVDLQPRGDPYGQ